MKLLILILFSWPVIFFAQQFDARSNRYSENSSHVNARDMMVTLDKGFVVVGNSEMFSGQIATGGFVFYSDSSGNNHWEKVYTSFGDFFSFETVLQLTDSSFIAGGKMFNPITNRHGAALLKLDKLGNEIWKKSIDDSTDDETSIFEKNSTRPKSVFHSLSGILAFCFFGHHINCLNHLKFSFTFYHLNQQPMTYKMFSGSQFN